jgi:hypothetical protein
MNETANERLVRAVAREVALEAMGRIRARLRAAEADPFASRVYEAEWVTENGAWPVVPMPAQEWLPFLREDLNRAGAEFESCLNH